MKVAGGLLNFFSFIIVLTLAGCATGSNFSSVEEGMSRDEVRHALGKQDEIEKRPNGWIVYYYKNRLISGFSWDKTDYYVIFNPAGQVDTYGHGIIDTRTSDRMGQLNVALPQVSQPIQNNVIKRRSISCTSTKFGGTETTNCNDN